MRAFGKTPKALPTFDQLVKNAVEHKTGEEMDAGPWWESKEASSSDGAPGGSVQGA